MARLDARQRRALVSSPRAAKANFVFPEKAPGSGSYPIHDINHARTALAYGSRYLSPAKLAVLKSKVRKKYPMMNVK